jgi:hypothetical protein
MKWKKLGQVINPEEFPELGHYAANPFALHYQNDVFKVFFNYRDNENRSYITFFYLDLANPSAKKEIFGKPVLSPGKDGLFDDNGVSLSCIIPKDDKLYLYYLGWNLCKRVPWRNSIGLAISEDQGDTFQKYSLVPIVDRSEIDPFSISYPFVLREGPLWRMWYGTNRNWGAQQEAMDHVIKYAESNDGIHWDRKNIVAIDHKDKDEYALSKPSILKNENIYRMWYSYRGDKYKIGFATSGDGIRWERKDNEVGIDTSPESSWDNKSICYPHVFNHKDNSYILYVGNDYGRGGLGLAVLENSSKTTG